jgi:hypothetical protein
MNEKSFQKFSDLIKDGFDLVKDASNLIIKKEQDTIEAFLEKKSPEIDQEVAKLEATKIGSYVTGEVSLILAEEDNFYFEGNFYFKKENGSWVTKTITGKKIPLSWCFTPDEQVRLRSAKKMTFEHKK